MTAILTVQNLRKRYGKLDAIQNLSFEIEQGSVFGFIGPNGAGKTTTMRILTTLLKPTSGEAWVARAFDYARPARRAAGHWLHARFFRRVPRYEGLGVSGLFRRLLRHP